jgi:hypothetical protein
MESGVKNVDATTSNVVSKVVILSIAGNKSAPMSVLLILVHPKVRTVETAKIIF